METPAFTPAENQASRVRAVYMMRHEKVRIRRKQHRTLSTLILIACILLAVMTVLLVPMLLGGAAAPAAAAVSEAAPVLEVQKVENVAQARAQLGFNATLPATLPDEYGLTAVNVVDASVLELEYTKADGKQTILYRTAPGSDDLTWDETEYNFTVTEEVDGITRSYAGVAEQKLSMALWAKDGYSYALVAPEGVGRDALHLMAESIS